MNAVDHIFRRERPVLACARVEIVQTIGTRAKVDLPPVQTSHRFATGALAQRQRRGRLLQRPFDQAGREADKVVIGDDRLRLAKQVERFAVIDAHSGAPQDFERRTMQRFALPAAQ